MQKDFRVGILAEVALFLFIYLCIETAAKIQASKTRKFALFKTSLGLTMSSPLTFPGGKVH